MDYSLWLSLVGLILSCVALARAWVPPQSRDVWHLSARVADLEAAHRDVLERLAKRAKQENMAKARDVRESEIRSARDLEDEALRVIQEAKGGGSVPGDTSHLDPQAMKRALRAKVFTGIKH